MGAQPASLRLRGNRFLDPFGSPGEELLIYEGHALVRPRFERGVVRPGGNPAGRGGYAFFYAEGTSYLSDDPRACVNCHIMREQFDSWQKSSHRAVAGCGDCHLPGDFANKWRVKAENGYYHSVAFTLQNFHEPIRIKPGNARVLNERCLGCHRDFVHGITLRRAGDEDDLYCVRCHAGTGHGQGS